MSVEKKVMLEVDHIAKTFFSDKGDTDAIENISIDVKENEFLVLLQSVVLLLRFRQHFD